MKILISGGAGFIGSALIRYLINDTDHSVINIDKLTYAGNLQSLATISDSNRYSFHKIDICSPDEIKEVFRRYSPDAVMHLAAESHVDRSINNPDRFIQTNIFGTYTLLEESRKYLETLNATQKEDFRFHHISTDEVFGDLGETIELFHENSPYQPSSPYSASKASSDHLVRAWGRTYDLPILVTNCSNNYGPFQNPEKLIPLIINNALNGKPLPVYGSGSQIRDWLYVEDHVKALLLVLLNGKIGSTYNIGGHNEIKNIDVVKTICSLLDDLCPSHLNDLKSFKNLITFVPDRPGHDVRYAIDASKIKNELGWSPIETFESGLFKTIQWYIANK